MPESNGPDTGGPASEPPTLFESDGDRFRFRIELRPSETTTISWKKLLKEATVTNGDLSSGPNGPGSLGAENQQQPFPFPAPVGKPLQAEREGLDPAGTCRLSSVIKKIERMFAGDNGSSDDEDAGLGDVPDEDDYDTEDPFIDDAELDDYFQVDKSKPKHDGFFINRGTLEQIEPPSSTIQLPKKRLRKDAMKEAGGNDDANNPPKKVKPGSKSQKASSLTERNLSNQSHGRPVTSVRSADVPHEAFPTNVTEISVKKKRIESKVALDSSENLNRHHSRVEKDVLQQIVRPSKKNSSKLKEGYKHQDTLTQKSIGQTSTVSKSHPGQQSDIDKLKQHIKEKISAFGNFDLKVPATPSRNSVEFLKDLCLPRKEGSSSKHRSAMLERAIRELEKIVSETRPRSTEVQIADNTSQAVKRRLTPEIKQKLAKVARLSYASDGTIPKEVLNRLMSIVGHLMQLRSLKRNMKTMANMGLAAKQEKDDQVKKTKNELAEMVTQRIQHIYSNIKQQTSNSDPFQESCPQEMKSLIRKYSMDDALENKICDLYELYVERLEEYSGPPVTGLYDEIAAFWPSGTVDSNGIKSALIRARKRKEQPNQQKDPEKLGKNKPTPKPKDSTSLGEAANTALKLTNVREKVKSDPRDQSSNRATKPLLNLAAEDLPLSFFKLPSSDRPKQEKRKGTSSTNSSTDGKVKKKKKASTEVGNYSRFRPENIPKERLKPNVKKQP